MAEKSNDEAVRTVLGSAGAQFLSSARILISSFEKFPASYKYMEPQAYEELVGLDWKKGNSVYWEETLGRAHLAAATSIIRSFKWLSGMCSSYSDALFLPFCASFRGLIESAADGYDGLGNVAALLAHNRAMIKAALELTAENPSSAKELEDQLIHFSHARKLSKGEEAPEIHQAKQVAQYVRGLESKGMPGLYECYSLLCQYTHPAAHSVAHLVAPKEDGTFVLIPSLDKELIKIFVEEYSEMIYLLMMFSFNPGALVLKVLLHLPVTEYQSQGVKKINFDGIPAWKKFAHIMQVEE